MSFSRSRCFILLLGLLSWLASITTTTTTVAADRRITDTLVVHNPTEPLHTSSVVGTEGYYSNASVVDGFVPGGVFIWWVVFHAGPSDVVLFEYLANGAQAGSPSIAESSVMNSWFDAKTRRYFGVRRPANSENPLTVVQFDVSTPAPTILSSCQLDPADLPYSRMGFLTHYNDQLYIGASSSLWMVNPTTCSSQQVMSGLPGAAFLSTCNVNGSELSYYSSGKIVFIDLDSLTYSSVGAPVWHPTYSRPILDSNTGDIYVSNSDNPSSRTLWYLPRGGNPSDWVNLCAKSPCLDVAGNSPKLIAADGRYTAATFDNKCIDGRQPVPVNPQLKDSSLLIGTRGFLWFFAYSAYLNCVVWESAKAQVDFGAAGYNIPYYDPTPPQS